MWKKEPAQVKEKYKERAEAVKRQHNANHPEYQYQPRKPSEKKRRMTKKKAAFIVTPMGTDSTSDTGLSATDFSPEAVDLEHQTFHDGQAGNFDTIRSTVDPLLFDPFTMPEFIPSFNVLNEGPFMAHEFDPQQSGLFEKMVQKHNDSLDRQQHRAHDSIAPQLIFQGFGDSTWKHHEEQLSRIDFSRRDAEISQLRGAYAAQHEAATTEAFNSMEHYEIDKAYHDNWMSNCASESERFMHLHDELADEFAMSVDPMLLQPLEDASAAGEFGPGVGLDTFMGNDSMISPGLSMSSAANIFDKNFFEL